jgi:DNA-binding response OmpR family regulator
MAKPEIKRALVAEDEECVRRVLCKLISLYGFDVTGVENGRMALDLFNQADAGFNLLVVDLDMPQMNGCDLVCEIRRLGHQLPIIAVTGFGSQELVDRISTCDVRLFEKPLDFKALHSHIEFITSPLAGPSTGAYSRTVRLSGK